MLCPYCGRDIADNTTICPACHGIVSEANFAGSAAQYAPSQYSHRNRKKRRPISQSLEGFGPESLEKPRNRKIAIGVVLAFVVLVALFFAVPLVQENLAQNRIDHRVTFLLKTPGYNDDATAIPVQVDGTLSDGESYSELVFLDSGGNGVVLEPGNYTLTFPGGSILSNGTVLVAPDDAKLEVEVAEDLPRNAFVQVSTDDAVSYKAVSPIDLTDETLEAVYEYAVQDPNDHGKANTLRENALSERTAAQEKQAEDTAALEKEANTALDISPGDEAKFVGTIKIQTAEEVASELNDDNILWNLGGHTLAVLWLDKTRKVTMDTSTSYNSMYDYSDIEDTSNMVTSSTYKVKCIALSTDVDGLYSSGDDGTLTAYEGKRVLVTGHVYLTEDWSSSLVSAITLTNPTFEVL